MRSYQNEEVKVQLDVGCASEVESDEMEVESDDFEGNFEEAEMYEDDDLYEKEVYKMELITSFPYFLPCTYSNINLDLLCY